MLAECRRLLLQARIQRHEALKQLETPDSLCVSACYIIYII
jgi:hypothetical protein